MTPDDAHYFSLGRAEGQADVKVRLRKIVDPHDCNHWDLDGCLKEVERLVKSQPDLVPRLRRWLGVER